MKNFTTQHKSAFCFVNQLHNLHFETMTLVDEYLLIVNIRLV